MTMKLLAAALDYLQAALAIIPCDRAAKQPRIPHWKPYQATLPTHAEVLRWFAPWTGADAIAIITGQVSGGLTVLDFDAPELFAPWAELVQATQLELTRLPVIRTQNGGYHVYYRASEIAGNQKLAVDPAQPNGKYTLIETRGEGGYVLAPPSPGYTLLQGDLAAIPFVSSAAQTLLLTAARQFTRLVEEQPRPRQQHSQQRLAFGLRPGDDYSQRGDVTTVLERHGWRFVRQAQAESFWRKPGKRRRGHSATLNYQGSGYFYVFSTNAPPFEPERGYSPFSVYALLEHGGDFRAAATTLQRMGYGA